MEVLQDVKFKLLREEAKLPTYTYGDSAGADLYAAIHHPISICPNQTVTIPLGFATEFDPHFVALIYARSGMATKRGIAPANKVSVIDADYRGEWLFPAHNHSDTAQTIEPGERIAQVIFHKVEHPSFKEVEELSSTIRGNGHYGSSGTK